MAHYTKNYELFHACNAHRLEVILLTLLSSQRSQFEVNRRSSHFGQLENWANPQKSNQTKNALRQPVSLERNLKVLRTWSGDRFPCAQNSSKSLSGNLPSCTDSGSSTPFQVSHDTSCIGIGLGQTFSETGRRDQ